MWKLLALTLLAVAVTADSVQEHDALIAEAAQNMPEHAAAFAELSAAAGTDDVFTVLDSISSNIEAERKHARVFYKSYKKTTERDLAKYRALIGKLQGNERRSKGASSADRHEIKQLRRSVNAHVRKLSRATARFHHVQQQERRTTHKKKSAMRHLNNKIADRKTYLRVLRSIKKALQQSDKPAATKFIEALAVAHQNGMSPASAAAQPAVLLQIAEDESEEEAIEQTTDNSDEVEADAEIDESAFEADEDLMPSANELEEVDEDEADEEAEDEEEADEEAEDEADEEVEAEADEALDEADEIDEVSEDEEESQEESESEEEAEAEADAELEVDDASDARMMQVLEKLASGTGDDSSIAELLQLIDELIADIKQSIEAAKKRKVEVLAKYTQQMKNLQELANSIKATIRRLREAVHKGRTRLADLEGTTHATESSSKETDTQLKAYRQMYKAIKANWKKYETRYHKNQKKRDHQLQQLAELKRRLAAIERSQGSLNIDMSKVALRYRWKAGPFGHCQAACGPSHRTRKVHCLSFSGKRVKHTFCDAQKKPKHQVKCQKKVCPADCVASHWKPKGKCSNQCGTGVRLHTRSIVEPARFGGHCPQQFKLTKHKACKSVKGCSDDAAKQAALASSKMLKDAAATAAPAPANAAVPSAADAKKKAAQKAKNKRCMKCKKGKHGNKCRIHNCLNKAQHHQCRACPKKHKKHHKKCRKHRCHVPAHNRQKKLLAEAAAAAAANGKSVKKHHKKHHKKCVSKCAKGKKGKHCRAKCHKHKKHHAKKHAKKHHKKHHKKCAAKCRKGKKGKKCRTKCRNAALRRAEERKRKEREERAKRRREREARRRAERERREREAKAAALAAQTAGTAPAAPAAPAASPAPASPAAPTDDSMSPEVVIPRFVAADN